MPINNVGGPGPTGGNPISDAAHEHVATVRHGETVSDVARRHGVETRSLLEANPQLKDAYQYCTAPSGRNVEMARGNTPAPLGDHVPLHAASWSFGVTASALAAYP